MADAPVPPQNLDAEESVLGAILVSSRTVLAAVAGEVSAHDFYRESHGLIYGAAVALDNTGEPVDAITLADWLERQPAPARAGDKENLLAAVGGQQRLHELAALVPATANAAHYARIVREMSNLRGLIRAGGEITRLGWDRPGDTAVLIESAEELIFKLSQGHDHQDMRHVGDSLRETFARLDELGKEGRNIIGVPTGYKVLDEITSGLQPGNLIVLAARPSMGKSGLAIGILANVAIRTELPVALFTLEMSQSEVTNRLLSMEALVESQRIRNGKLDEQAWDRLLAAGGRIEKAPIYIEDSGAMTMPEIRAKARRLKMRHPKLALLAVDYLQLMSSDAENRVQEVSKISRSLKVLAGELDLPILALSQLSRAVETRHDRRPILSDLRESGSIEQDADIVMFIYRDEYYNPEDAAEAGTEGIAEINVAKYRNGPTGVRKLAFTKRYARFADLAVLPGMGAEQF